MRQRQSKPGFSAATIMTGLFGTLRTPFRRRIKLAPPIENVRADKIAQIQEALKAGTYIVRSQDVADKVIAHTILDATLTGHTQDRIGQKRMPKLSLKRRQNPVSKFYGLIEFLSLGFSRHSGNVHM